jgi:hypothetical protein
MRSVMNGVIDATNIRRSDGIAIPASDISANTSRIMKQNQTYQGTPNMPLQLDSITKSWNPCFLTSGVRINSTLRSPPYPPVMPAKNI